MTTQTDQRTRSEEGPDRTDGDPRVAGTGTAWLLVARREILVKATDRSFLIGTAVSLAIIAGLVGLQIYLGGRTQEFRVAVTPSAVTLAESVRTAAPGIDEDVVVHVHRVADDAAARAEVTDGTADAWLHRGDGGWVLATKSDFEDDLRTVVAEVVRAEALRENAGALGTTPEALERGAALEETLLEGDAQRAELVSFLSFAFVFLFYMAAVTFGVALANSVVEEKQSRIVEIIATAIPLRHLLAGKVVGNTVLAVVQIALFVSVGLVGMSFTDYSTLTAAVSGAAVWFLVFFLAGFVALACLWAVAGALASRTEDLQTTTTPLIMVLVAVLFGGMFLEGTWQTAGSYVPPLSATLMPVRVLDQDVAWWEPLVALALLLASAALTVKVGERLYRRALLKTGGLVSLRQAWRTEE
jgi:ABC-2 type transport system permease protein